MSLEPEYERLHRKMHAQLREIYRKNGGLPIGEEDLNAALQLHERQIAASFGLSMLTWSPPAVLDYVTNGYETGKKAAVVIPESQGKTLQQTLDDALAKAQEGTPMTITFAGAYADIPSLRKVTKEIEPPDGVHILKALRVGGETKSIYLERLREAYSGEYLSLTELNSRMDAAMKAETEEELKRLVGDLPPYSPPSKEEKLPEKKKERTWTDPSVIVPALAALLGCYNSVIVGIHGSFSELIPSLIITGLFVFLMCIGVAKGKSSGTP